MKRLFTLLLLSLHLVAATGQVQAFMKLWDNKHTYPRINQIEFQGDVPTLDSYNAIYGHGAMMENEYWGLRIYMDHRQSIDLFGKSGRQLELHLTNFYSTREDLAKGLGCDILWAGQSVAAGSLRGFIPDGTDADGIMTGHTVYVDTVAARGQRIMREGPDTCAVMVWDRDWMFNGHKIYMQQVYCMRKGSRELEVDIYFKGETEDDYFATGVQKLEIGNQGFIEMMGRPEVDPRNAAMLLASWGRNVPDKNAPDLVEGVGIGVKVPLQYVVTTLETGIDYLAVLQPVNHHISYTLSVCSLREKDGPKTAEDWFNLLRK